jgi:hypothetical protein
MNMRIYLILGYLLFPLINTQAQTDLSKSITRSQNKGKMFLYWGWNREGFTKSDIHFKGENYDFTLHDVRAHDRQSHLNYNPYLKLNAITIPQYNFRLGYFINNSLNISIGQDHMKYVMIQNQTVTIDGTISNSGTPFDGVYGGNDKMVLTDKFLMFEHTDGLNYLNIEINKFKELKHLGSKITLNYMFGLGAGVLYPRSNVTLLGKPRHDEFHVAGYGASAKVGLNFTFYKYYFLQFEAKGGYINMPDIRTTMYPIDKAKQHFAFAQGIAVFGINIPVFNQSKSK